MKFIVLAKYTKQGTDGWLDNPDEDRRAMISGLSEKIGGKLLDLSYTRGIYDVVAVVEAPNADIMTSLKLFFYFRFWSGLWLQPPDLASGFWLRLQPRASSLQIQASSLRSCHLYKVSQPHRGYCFDIPSHDKQENRYPT